MHNRIDRLTTILPVPASPLELPSESDWQRCEQAFGPLPADYRQFIGKYGSGAIDQFLWVLNPGSRNRFLELEAQVATILRALQETRTQSVNFRRFPVFPDNGGLLPVAITDNGDTVYWLTGGAPADWTIGVLGPRAPEMFRYDGGLVDFLVDILTQRVRCDPFPEDFPDAVVEFNSTAG